LRETKFLIIRQLLVWLGQRLLAFLHWLIKTKLVSAIVTLWDVLPSIIRQSLVWLGRRSLAFFRLPRKTKLVSAIVPLWYVLPSIIRQLLVWLRQRLLAFFHWLKQTELVFAIVALWKDLLSLLHRTFSDLFQFWCNLTDFTRKLVINLIIGLSFTWILLTFLYDIPFLREREDQGMDLVMQLNKGIIPSFQKNHIPHFVFLDIDDETHQNWGEPLFTPRNKVKELIATAVEAEAKLVIVDIDLSRETPIEGLELSKLPTPIAGLELPKPPYDQELYNYLDNATACKLSKHPYDQELYDYLENYATACKNKENKSPCPPIILLRTFSKRPNCSLSILDIITKKNLNLPILTPRASFLDELVERSAPYIQWGSALFSLSADQVERRWWLYQPICVQQQSEIVPSIELLAAVLIRNSSFQQQPIDWKSFLVKSESYFSGYSSSQPGKPIEIGNLTINLDDTILGIRQRIMYKIPWEVSEEPPCSKVLSEKSPCSVNDKDKSEKVLNFRHVNDKDKQVILRVYPVHDYKRWKINFKNTIVVIGGSYRDSGDIHLTPIGEMPSAMILINAIHSLLQYGTIESLTIGWKLLFQTGLIILVCVLSAGFEYLIMKWFPLRSNLLSNLLYDFSLISWVFIILLIVPISIVLLRYGIWLDFVIPLMLIQINLTMQWFGQFMKA
jgi:CHASE2 domain-containing sensor protein